MGRLRYSPHCCSLLHRLPCPHRRTPPFSHSHTHPTVAQTKKSAGAEVLYILFYSLCGWDAYIFIGRAIVINKRRTHKEHLTHRIACHSSSSSPQTEVSPTKTVWGPRLLHRPRPTTLPSRMPPNRSLCSPVMLRFLGAAEAGVGEAAGAGAGVGDDSTNNLLPPFTTEAPALKSFRGHASSS